MPASSQSENSTTNNNSSVIQAPQQQPQHAPQFPPETNSHTIATLLSMLHSQEPSPSEYFILIIKKCKSPPKIENFVIELTSKVRDYLKVNGSVQMTDDSLDATGEITLKMFYKLIDCILPEETEKPAFDPNILLNQDAFIKALFACAVEIVFFSLSEEHLKFPKVLKVLDIPPYYFYRIIEVVVRQGDLLTRDIVKHLNTIEESVLESMAWKCDSPLWRAVIDSGLPVPSYEDVNPNLTERQKVRSYKLSRLPSFNKEGIPNSPGAPLADKFLSPCLKRNYSQIENLNLTSDNSGETPVKIFVANAVDNREVKIITIPKSNAEQTSNDNKNLIKELPDIQKENKKPRRSGSLALFFRKFYQLAAVRLKDLCDWLKITNWDSIWTCFESTIVNNVGLLFERHLDQLLLCAIYVVCKIEGLLPSFVDMMRCYRYLPQATSSVYRNVLIKPDRTLEDIKNNINDLTELAKIDNEIRGDIVKFYNEVFIHKVKTWAKKFRENERVVLSPLPIGKTASSNLTSRVSGTGLPILLRSLDHNSQSPTNSPAQHSYIFSRSPAKDLQSINRMVNCKDLAKTRKQLLNDDDNKTEQNNIVSRKMKDLYTDRLNVNNQNQN